jgi:hypothetical protein
LGQAEEPYGLKKDKDQINIDGTENHHGGYYLEGNHRLIADYIHPEWQKLIGNNDGNVRLCHHNHDLTYCGACNLGHGFVIPTQEVKIKYGDKKSDYRKRYAKNKQHKGQYKMEFR